MYLFFDTETTGLPKKWNAPVTDTDNWPRLVQFAWLEYTEGGSELSRKNYIIKPEGFTIPKAASNIHGISTEVAQKEGVDLSEALEEFAIAINNSKAIVAHNVNFDEKIVGSEFIRKGISNRLFDKERICTMSKGSNFCKIKGPRGYKWPKLSELYKKLFDASFENAHDALADVRACAKCFFELKKIGVID